MNSSLFHLNTGDQGPQISSTGVGDGFIAIRMDFFFRRANTFTLFILVFNQAHLRRFWAPCGNVGLPRLGWGGGEGLGREPSGGEEEVSEECSRVIPRVRMQEF